MTTKESSRDPSNFDPLDTSTRGSLSAPAPEEGVRLLRAFAGIRQPAHREAVVELVEKLAARAESEAAVDSATPLSVTQILDATRVHIAQVTGSSLDRVKLHLEIS